MWGTIISGIISALFGAGATVYATNKQNEATAAAGKESKGLALLQRSDVLAENAASRRITLKELAQRKKEAEQANQISRGQLAVSQGTLALNQAQFSEGQKQYNNQQLTELAKTITDRANKDPSYKTQLLQFWGA